MNRKGFTLIELLVTIALLAVITTISFVSINAMIKKSKVRECENIINSLISATNEYVSDKRYDGTIPSEITAADLKNGHYLNGDIINPFTKQTVNPTIRIELNSDYTLKKATVTSGLSCTG